MSATDNFYGFVELDGDGTVLYARVEKRDGWTGPVPDLRGCNFYTECAPFDNVEELHGHLDTFRNGSELLEIVSFTCRYRDGPVPVKILLARVFDPTNPDVTKSILVHIKKVQ